MTNSIHAQIETGSPPAKHPLPGRSPSTVLRCRSTAEHRPSELIALPRQSRVPHHQVPHAPAPRMPSSISAQDQPEPPERRQNRLTQDEPSGRFLSALQTGLFASVISVFRQVCACVSRPPTPSRTRRHLHTLHTLHGTADPRSYGEGARPAERSLPCCSESLCSVCGLHRHTPTAERSHPQPEPAATAPHHTRRPAINSRRVTRQKKQRLSLPKDSGGAEDPPTSLVLHPSISTRKVLLRIANPFLTGIPPSRRFVNVNANVNGGQARSRRDGCKYGVPTGPDLPACALPAAPIANLAYSINQQGPPRTSTRGKDVRSRARTAGGLDV